MLNGQKNKLKPFVDKTKLTKKALGMILKSQTNLPALKRLFVRQLDPSLALTLLLETALFR